MCIQIFIIFNYAPLLGLVYCLQAHSTAFENNGNITSPVPWENTSDCWCYAKFVLQQQKSGWWPVNKASRCMG